MLYAVKNRQKGVLEYFFTLENLSPKENNDNIKLICYSGLGDKEKIIELIERGADINAKDNEGRNALYWAKKDTLRNNSRVIAYLESIIK